MNIVLADLDAPGLEARSAALKAAPGRILSITADVTKAGDMDALANAAYQTFGAVNLLCLNAGLSIRKPFAELQRNDWQRVLDVQFHGVLNGVLSFLPHLGKQNGSRHILITASMSGVGRADLRTLNAPYVVAKHAVVGLAEVMKPSLKASGVGVSVLCPGMTVSDPDAAHNSSWQMPSAAWYNDNLLSPDEVAKEAVQGMAEDRLYIFPHRAGRQEVIDRYVHMLHGFDQAGLTAPLPRRGSSLVKR